jgi:hypothetical protein
MRGPLPASCSGLDLNKAYRALIKHHGNVSRAAKLLKVPAPDLRSLIRIIPRLIDAALEAEEQALDEAEAVMRATLKHPDMHWRLEAAGHILRTSPAARRRGWRPGYGVVDLLPEPPSPVSLVWENPKPSPGRKRS